MFSHFYVYSANILFAVLTRGSTPLDGTRRVTRSHRGPLLRIRGFQRSGNMHYWKRDDPKSRLGIHNLLLPHLALLFSFSLNVCGKFTDLRQLLGISRNCVKPLWRSRRKRMVLAETFQQIKPCTYLVYNEIVQTFDCKQKDTAEHDSWHVCSLISAREPWFRILF